MNVNPREIQLILKDLDSARGDNRSRILAEVARVLDERLQPLGIHRLRSLEMVQSLISGIDWKTGGQAFARFGELVLDISRLMLAETAELKFESETSKRLVIPASFAIDPIVEHSARTALLSAMVAKEMSLPDSEAVPLVAAAIFHDIGMFALDVWKLARVLSASERLEVERHVDRTCELLSMLYPVRSSREPIEEIARSHHERFDGTGYPDKKNSSVLSRPARILQAIDSFAAMASSRSWRQSYSTSESLVHLVKNSGRLFENSVVQAIARVLIRAGIVECGESYVLVVDDDPVIGCNICAYLDREGYRALVVEDGLMALTLLESGFYNVKLVLLDVMMPEMSGMDFVSKLRDNPAISDIPVIMISGNVSKSTILKAEKLGVAGYLAKPFRMHDLLARVRQFVKAS
jgi:response regulator RpfG family c-di-GMP phosphodiesterase